MGSFAKNVVGMGVFVVAGILSLGVPGRALGDDGDSTNSNPSAKAGKKADAPAAFTERERMLLDRVEQLERRVEELEAKSGTPKKTDGTPASMNAE